MGFRRRVHSLLKDKDDCMPRSIYLPLWPRSFYDGDLSTKVRSYFHGHEHSPIIFSLYFFMWSTSCGRDSPPPQLVCCCSPCWNSILFCYAKDCTKSPFHAAATQTFLNETSQTQRQILVQSIGRCKLFHRMLDCQEEFCKCFNEAWTAPRQGCQKLIPDDLQYWSSSSSLFPSNLFCFASFLFGKQVNK